MIIFSNQLWLSGIMIEHAKHGLSDVKNHSLENKTFMEQGT